MAPKRARLPWFYYVIVETKVCLAPKRRNAGFQKGYICPPRHVFAFGAIFISAVSGKGDFPELFQTKNHSKQVNCLCGQHSNSFYCTQPHLIFV
ncbi:MAG: hypothetical protein D6714_15040 [Bacteroidetes bacterium]|nr:MAG: hypothetical protein D6714_15040 [Bacteroidota bacterium]